MRSFCCGFSLALLAGCSTTPAITLSATPNSVGGDGQTEITVTATVTEGGSPSQTADVVHFKAVLNPNDDPTGASLHFKDSDPGTPLILDGTASNGIATATLIAPRRGRGTIDVTASASVGGAEPQAKASVALKPAGALAASVDFTCAKQNIGAFVHGASVSVICTATAKDSAGHVITNASIETRSEAGLLAWQLDDAGKQQLVYSVTPGMAKPKDVDPLDSSGNEQAVCPAACTTDPRGAGCAGEPCWTDPTNLTHNPRDGVATLIVAVPGVTAFDDLGEPYVDANDNGTRDADETFIDVNGNGKWDKPNGANLTTRMVWKAFRIIWSGALDTGVVHGATWKSSLSGKTAAVTLYLNDQNLNALAADGASLADVIALDGSGTCDGADSATVTLAPASVPLDQTHPGILFNAADGSISTPGLHSTYMRGTDYSFNATIGGASGQKCPLAASIDRTYDPGPDASQLTEGPINTTVQF